MKKRYRLFVTLLIGLVFIFTAVPRIVGPSQAKSLDEMNLEEIEEAISQLDAAIGPLEKEVGDLRNKIASVKNRIAGIEARVNQLEENITQRTKDLVYQKTLFDQKVRNQYIKQRSSTSPLLVLFSNEAAEAARQISFSKKTALEDQEEVINLAEDLLQLKKDKESLDQVQKNLTALKADFADRQEFLQGEIESAQAYRAQLSAKQEQLLAEKYASLNLPESLGAGSLYCTDDREIDPGFSPAFAFYTYGIPHRVGLNQYGAYGRAKAGQNHEQILQAYFSDINFTQHDNINITVDGHGAMPLEQYMLGIYEMPGDWSLEALKAQAIAARSYALSYTDNGAKSICTTQQCQVYKGGNKGGKWEQAVKETAGKIMKSGDRIVTAWYASTAGGYTFFNSDVWGGSRRPWTQRLRDTTGEVNSFAELHDRAYDKDSPCFYSAQGWREEYGNSAWLKPSEVADIVNVLLLVKKDASAQKHISQVDKPNPDGVETWDANRVKSELKSHGGQPFNTISSISVGADFGQGKSTGVSVSGDAGTTNFSANDFTDYFNLRAPANIQIVGPLFNVEKR